MTVDDFGGGVAPASEFRQPLSFTYDEPPSTRFDDAGRCPLVQQRGSRFTPDVEQFAEPELRQRDRCTETETVVGLE